MGLNEQIISGARSVRGGKSIWKQDYGLNWCSEKALGLKLEQCHAEGLVTSLMNFLCGFVSNNAVF